MYCHCVCGFFMHRDIEYVHQWNRWRESAAHFVSHVRLHHHGHASVVTERPPVAHCRQRPGHHLMFTEAESEASWKKHLLGLCRMMIYPLTIKFTVCVTSWTKNTVSAGGISKMKSAESDYILFLSLSVNWKQFIVFSGININTTRHHGNASGGNLYIPTLNIHR